VVQPTCARRRHLIVRDDRRVQAIVGGGSRRSFRHYGHGRQIGKTSLACRSPRSWSPTC
jgi:hypothetical protein